MFCTRCLIKHKLFYTGKFYANAGSDIPFGKLFVELDKRFPMEKVRFLKDHVRCKFCFFSFLKDELNKRSKGKKVFDYQFVLLLQGLAILNLMKTKLQNQKMQHLQEMFLIFLSKRKFLNRQTLLSCSFYFKRRNVKNWEKNALNMPKSTTQCIIMKHHQVLFFNNELLIY